MAARVSSFLLFLFLFGAPAKARWWKVETSGIDTNLRAVSAVHAQVGNAKPFPVVWTSGSNGVILKSLDEGKTWQRLHVQDGEALDFRGIVAFSEKTAYLMSSGDGDKSRIYKTTDGGGSWELQYRDDRREFFLDSIACLHERACLALGDPINGKFLLLRTADGEHWNPLPSENMPLALPGEGAFAASNSVLIFSGEDIVFGTGGTAARLFHSSDGGRSWTVARTPLVQGNAWSGIFSLGRAESGPMIAVGGDYKDPNYRERVAATSSDNGKTWQLAARQPGGFRSGLALLGQGRLVAVGPNGEDVTTDRGVHWKHTDSLNLNAVAILDAGTGWAVGPHGTIARLASHFRYSDGLSSEAAAVSHPSRPAAASLYDFLAPGFKWSYSSCFSDSSKDLFAEVLHDRSGERQCGLQFRPRTPARSAHFSPRRHCSRRADGHAWLGPRLSR